MPRLLLIDNYDSFTFNLARMLEEISGVTVEVRRNNVGLNELIGLDPTGLIISPGPGAPPDDTGITCDAIRHFADKIPVLGVCLGHQAIGQVYGGKIVRASVPFHGKATPTEVVATNPLFTGTPRLFMAGRYHSLVVEEESFPGCLEISARAAVGAEEIMALRHRTIPHIYGVQFHPESVLTAPSPEQFAERSWGRRILNNFATLCK